MDLELIDLSKRKPKQCPHCQSQNFKEKHALLYVCLDCKGVWCKLVRGEMYLKK